MEVRCKVVCAFDSLKFWFQLTLVVFSSSLRGVTHIRYGKPLVCTGRLGVSLVSKA